MENALKSQYGPEFIQEIHIKYDDIRCLMFDDFYTNDVCYKYHIDEMEEYNGYSWQDEAHIRLENCIKTFLRDIFPNFDYVAINIIW